MQDGIEQGWFRSPKTKKVPLGPPDLNGILLTAKEIAAALGYLHQTDVLHGDLTGNNILLASSHQDYRHFTVKVSCSSLLTHSFIMQVSGVGHKARWLSQSVLSVCVCDWLSVCLCVRLAVCELDLVHSCLVQVCWLLWPIM